VVKALVECDSDLGPGVGQQRALGLPRRLGAADVADRERASAPRGRLPQRGERVCCFSALRDGDRERSFAHDRLPVAILGCVVDLDLDVRELLEQELADQAGVPRRAAGEDGNALELLQLLFGKREIDRDLVPVEVALPGAGQSLRLLEDFLLHVVGVTGKLRRLVVPLDMLRLALHLPALAILHQDSVERDLGDIAVFQEQHLVSVRQQRRDVGRDETLTRCQAEHQWRSGSRDQDLIGVIGMHAKDGVDAAHAADRGAEGLLEAEPVLHQERHQEREALGIGFALRNDSAFFQLGTDLQKILEDAVVNDHDLAVSAGVRMGVVLAGTAVRRPARVTDPDRSLRTVPLSRSSLASNPAILPGERTTWIEPWY
jgi:hypothetical protein